MPVYDKNLAFLYANFSTFFAWILAKTFPFLKIQRNEFPGFFGEKYKVLNESFKEYIENVPGESGRSVEEFIAKTLTGDNI